MREVEKMKQTTGNSNPTPIHICWPRPASVNAMHVFRTERPPNATYEV
jgi:hypothetical protein